MFAWVYGKRDRVVGEMLLSTFNSYHEVFKAHGRQFLLNAIAGYPGLMLELGLGGELRYRYPNELFDLIFTGDLTQNPYYFRAQGQTIYQNFVVTMPLAENGQLLVSDPAHVKGRAKSLAKWFEAQGATTTI